MVIKEYNGCISNITSTLVSMGYGKYTTHSVNFNRYFSEEQKQENHRKAELLRDDHEAWGRECDKAHHAFYEAAQKMLEALGAKYKLYQYNTDKFNEPYDYFFYSNQGWNERDWFDYCQLCFDHKDPDRNDKQLEELMNFLAKWDGDPDNLIEATIQRDTWIDKARLAEAVKQNISKVVGKTIELGFNKGKVKWVESNNEYGFFKRGAKRYYSPLAEIDLAGIMLDMDLLEPVEA